VGGNADIKSDDPAGPAVLSQLDGAIEGRSGARDYQLARAIVVGKLYGTTGIPLRLGADLVDYQSVQTQNGCHATGMAFASVGHQPTTFADKAESVGEGERTGEYQGAILAEAMTGSEIWPDLGPHSEDTKQSHARGEDGGLGVDRVSEISGRALKDELGQRESENIVCLMKEVTSYRFGLVEFASHADGLRSLTRKEKSDRVH
jgi:hypothetical protein